ncbi:MAG TPA: NYN domain-containing protein [Candidatus Kaiserbacteria bacterium]|nr:NYN domain-containing protein [Candidatus Kaiserbacteria bacterium]
MKKEENNLAFVDAQNLHFGTTKCYTCAEKLGLDVKKMKLSDCTCNNAWKVDLLKFRVYLNEKYGVKKAYYFLGCINEDLSGLYDEIQEAGFILKFREHNTVMLGKKKGNVDSDIIFNIMKKLYQNDDFNKIILVSGDGDYKMLVDFLITENKFEKILFPNRKFASSLYKKITGTYYDYLDNLRNKIGKKKRGP